MFTAFKQYLQSLKLSPVSRKLYLSDIRRFLTWIGQEPTIDQLIAVTSYTRYIEHLRSEAIAPSMMKRTQASLKQFGTFLSLTYSVKNPMSNFSLTSDSTTVATEQLHANYIKYFTNYLTTGHLSPLTIKSYKSDITRYLDWGTSNISSTQLPILLTDKNIKIYLNYLSQSGSSLPSTIERKMKSIERFKAWFSSSYPSSSVSDSNIFDENHIIASTPSSNTQKLIIDDSKLIQSPDVSENIVKNNYYRIGISRIWTPSFRNFASLAILLVFASTLSVFGYRQFTRDANITAAFPSTPVTPNRQLSFQGRLEDAGGTPISSATNITFKLFDDATVGTQLYTSGVCSITPDSDGVFSTQIGSTCGSAIGSSVFTENSNVWLEVTVVAETLTPRQPIASVAYALNSETIQGFPISSTVSAIRNTVVPMNEWGEIIVGEQSPRLKGVSGTFQISAPSISITTATGTNGNITLAPDGTGQVNLNGNTTSTSFFNISNAQLTTGSLITGTAANNNVGFKLIDLLSGSSPTSKFSVDATGLTTVGADLYVNSGISTYGTAVSTGTVEAIKFCTGDGETNCVTDFSTITGGSTIWTDGGSYIYPTASEVLGNSTSAGANKLAGAYLADSAPLVFGTDNDVSYTFAGTELGISQGSNDINFDANTLFIDGSANNIGIGDATPDHKLDVAGNIGLDASSYLNWGDTDGTSGYGFRDNSGTIEFKNSAGSWTGIGTAGGATNWRYNLGTLSPLNDTIDLLVGGNSTSSAKFAVLNVNSGTPTASVSAGVAGGAYLTSTGTLATTAKQSLTLGDINTGNIDIADTTANKIIHIGGNTNSAADTIQIGTNATAADTITIGNNHASTTVSLTGGNAWNISSSGQATFSNNLTANGSQSVLGDSAGDILDIYSGILSYKNASTLDLINSNTSALNIEGGLMNFDTTNSRIGIGDATPDHKLDVAGNIGLDASSYLNWGDTDGTAGYGLRDNAGTIEFKNSAGVWAGIGSGSGGGTNWRYNLGTLSPLNSTVDLLVGGTATSSARAAFLNINSGTPTASVSAGAAGGTFMTADGYLSTTARQSLTLGNSATFDTTGNILLNPNGTGNVGIGTTNPSNKLEVSGTTSTKLRVVNSGSNSYIDLSSGAGSPSLDMYSAGTLIGNIGSSYVGTDIALWGRAGRALVFGTNNTHVASFDTSGNFLPATNDTFDLGSDSLRFKDIYLGGETLHIGTSTTDEGTIAYNTSTNVLNIGTDSTTNGTIQLGDAITDNLDFQARVLQDADLIPITATGTNDLGSTSLPWDNLYANNLSYGSAGTITLADNTANAFQLKEGANVYFDITTTNNTESLTLNLPVGGATSHTANLFNANIAQTINIGTGTAIDTINIGTGITSVDDINLGGLSTSHVDITGITNFAGGTTYFVDASGNAKFLDLQVADTGNPGLTVGNGTIGYIKVGGSTISDNSGNLTLDSDSAALTIAADDTTLTATGLATLDMAATVAWDVATLNAASLTTLNAGLLATIDSAATVAWDVGTLNATTLSSFDTAASLTLGTTTLTLDSNSTINGGSAANNDITIQGTSNATRTTSYVILQPTAGFVGIGTSAPGKTLTVNGDIEISSSTGKFYDTYVTAGISLGATNETALSGFGASSIVGALNELKNVDKNTSHNDYLNWTNHYVAKNEGSTDPNNKLSGLFFDNFFDSTKFDGTTSTASGIIQASDPKAPVHPAAPYRVGLMGGQTYQTSATTTDNDGQGYLGANAVTDIYYYDRTRDSSPEVLVELGIDPNWYNGVTLSVATSSANYSQAGTLANKNPNLTTTYNGSLIKATGTDSTPHTIYITIKTPTTFDWNTYHLESGTSVTITPGTAQTLGGTGVSVTFSAVNYNVGDVFKIASWFIEPEGTSPSTRGAKQQFPERSNIVATASSVDIIDADSQKLWMSFSQGTNFGLQVDLNNNPSGVKMLNGNLSISMNGSAGIGLIYGHFDSDVIQNVNATYIYTAYSGIAQRNIAIWTSWTRSTALNLVATIANDVDMVVSPNQPTQEITVSGWGYISGSASQSLSETVYLPYKFSTSPTVIASWNAYKSTTAPKNLAECTTNTYRIEAHTDGVTNSTFGVRLSLTDGADGNLSASNYYCYTWTATGIVSPKQFIAVATGNSSTDGGVTVFNSTDGTEADVFVGSQFAGTQYQNKIALTTNGGMYFSHNDVTNSTAALEVYYGIHGLSTESSWAAYYSGAYRIAASGSATWSNGGPVIRGTSVTDTINSLYVTENTSTVDTSSNTIYAGSSLGVTIIQEKQGHGNGSDSLVEREGSAKWYTTNYISEEAIGDLRGMWPLNNGNISSDLEDISVYSNALTGTNIGAGTDSVSGVRGTATDFDGTTEYLSIADDPDFDFSTTFSANVWVKTTDADGLIFRKYQAATEDKLLSVTTGGVVQFYLHNVMGGSAMNSVRSINDNNWHHIAVTYDGTISKIFIDGVLDSTKSSSGDIADGTGALYIGQSSAGTSYFSGYIDELAISATVPTSGQIMNMYQTGYRALQSQQSATSYYGSVAYTNDPAAGSNISLSIADTTGLYVGDSVYVSSSAGAEYAIINTVTANTSIVVNTLSLNHTTTTPLVYRQANQHLTGLSTGTNVIGAVAPDFNNQYMYVGLNSTTLGGVSKIQLNNDTNVKMYTASANAPTGGTTIVDEDVSALGVGYNLETVGSAASGVKSMAPDNNANGTIGTLYSETQTLASSTKFAYLWVSRNKDASDASSNIIPYGCVTQTTAALCTSNSAWVAGTPIQVDNNQTPAEQEYNFTFPTAGSSLTLKFEIYRGSTKTNTYISQYGIMWGSSVGGADIAERYQSSEPAYPGDIVSISSQGEDGVATVDLSRTAYDQKAIGIVTTNPGIVMDENLVDLNWNAASRNSPDRPAVALAGRVPVKVTTKNGPIMIGDPITSSTQAGVGIKATQAGTIIGKALEKFDCSSPSALPSASDPNICTGTVLTFVNVGHYEPIYYLSDAGEFIFTGNELVDDATATPSGSPLIKLVRVLADGSKEVVDRIGTFGSVITGSLKSQELEVASISPIASGSAITINAPVIIKKQAPELIEEPLLVVDGEIDAATISARLANLEEVKADRIVAGEIIADSISANSITGLDARIASLSAGTTTTLSDTEIDTITDRIKSRIAILTGSNPTAQDLPTPEIVSDSNQELVATNISDYSIASDSAMITSLTADFDSINTYLSVVGTATITDLNITNTLTANSISSSDLTLALQPQGGIINLAANTLIVDSNGQVAINGDLTISGKILADSAEFNSLSLGNSATSSATSALGQLLAIYNEQGQQVATIDASGSANLASITTQMITIAAGSSATDSSTLSSTTTSNATAGSSVLVSPNTDILIKSPHVTSNSLIYLTPTGYTDNKVVFVKSKTACDISNPDVNQESEPCISSFTVGIDSPASQDITFNWWIIKLAE